MARRRKRKPVCPLCNARFIVNVEMVQHVAEDHRDWLDEWYASHPENFKYVRRYVARKLKGCIVGHRLGHGPVVYSDENAATRARKCSTASELLSLLEELRAEAVNAEKTAPLDESLELAGHIILLNFLIVFVAGYALDHAFS